MHTKLSILIIIFMVLIPTTIIAISSGKRTGVKGSYSNQSRPESPFDGKLFDYEKDAKASSGKAEIHKYGSIPFEEDGKHHHFHFHRIRRQRYSAIFKFISKIILLIVHFAVMFCSYLHCLH